MKSKNPSSMNLLKIILPSQMLSSTESTFLFYQHVASIYENVLNPSGVVLFSRLALEKLVVTNDDDLSIASKLYKNIFGNLLELKEFDDAYSAIILNPVSEVYYNLRFCFINFIY